MAKFIIGVDAFSDPEGEGEQEFITHTEHPKFIAEIIFVETNDKLGFKFDSLKVLWKDDCKERELSLALSEAEKAIAFYTKKSMELDI